MRFSAPQVTLLASGRLMYTGPTDGLVRWFTSLGYYYDPTEHGMASDWALDLVSLGFTKPQQGTRQQQDQQQPAVESDDSDDNCSVQPASILPSRGSSSRFRGLASVASGSIALHGVGSRHYQQAQQQSSQANKCSMMSSKQELNEAAGAFLQRLHVLHPSWFVHSDDAAWRKRDSSSGGGADSNSPSGLSPIKVHRGPAQVPAGNADFQAAAADVDESPFMQQDATDIIQDPLQAHQGAQLYLTPTALLEQGQEREQGVWNATYGGWRKYCALLWREALITTR